MLWLPATWPRLYALKPGENMRRTWVKMSLFSVRVSQCRWSGLINIENLGKT
jgi:hypothetical protein